MTLDKIIDKQMTKIEQLIDENQRVIDEAYETPVYCGKNHTHDKRCKA